MMKTFVLIEELGGYGESCRSIRYAGNNEEKAFGGLKNVLSGVLEVWFKEQHIESYEMDDTDNLNCFYNLKEELTKEVEERKREIAQKEDILKELKTL